MICGFWLFAVIVYAVMEWALPAIYSGTPNAPSGINYGTSFVVPFSRAFAPWITGVIVVLGPIAALRSAIDRSNYRRRVNTKRR